MKHWSWVFIVTFCLILNGCSGIKNIQDLTYIVGIGLDYDEEKKEYTAYVQGLNFANVAKQEGARSVEPVPIFVASHKGETLNMAVSKLYKKSEPPLFFGHVEVIVLSKKIVEKKFSEVIKELGRNRSLRHTLRLVTTDEKIEDVFNTRALFNYPAVYTVLYKKGRIESTENEIKPISLLRFLRAYHEPMGTATVPSVKIDKSTWKADEDYSTLYFEGYTVFQHQEFRKSVSFENSLYMNWLLDKGVSIDEKIEDDGKLIATVKMAAPKMKIKYEKGTDTPRVSIVITGRAELLEKIEDVPINKLTKLLEAKIKEKVKTIYQEGLENEMDLLNVGEKWYRQHPNHYQNLKKKGSFYLDKNSLQELKVKFEIYHFNTYKYK